MPDYKTSIGVISNSFAKGTLFKTRSTAIKKLKILNEFIILKEIAIL